MYSIEDYLLRVTQNETAQVIDALAHLAAFSDVRTVTAIQNAFFHPAPEVRFAAAQAAGENLDEALLDALLSLLDDEDPQVRLATVIAAGEFAKHSRAEAIILALLERQPEPQTAEAVKTILLQAGSGVIPILESELESLDKKRRERAIELLPYMGDLGVMTLITHLPNLNVWESMKSARMLGELDHPMLVDYFLEMLQDLEVEKRRFAMAAVGEGRTTFKAIQAVGEVLLSDPDQHMRLDATVYLKWARHPAVLTYFDQFDAAKEKGLYGRWMREIIRDTRIMLDLQEKPFIEVLELLFAGEQHERPLACVEISRREDPIAIPFLASALLSERYSEAQQHILVSLSELEAVEALDDILAFFHHAYSNKEDALALRTLGKLYHPKALGYLRKRASKPILNDIPAETEPIYAARQAVKTTEARMGFLRQAWFTLMGEEDEKQVFIALQLAMRGDDRGMDLLIQNFKQTNFPAIRYQTLRALGETGSIFALPFLREVLLIPDERLTWHALNAIGQLPLDKAPVEVSAMLLDESPVVRMAALFALGRLRDSETLPHILKRLDDPDHYVRAVALQTLAKFPFDAAWWPRLEPLVSDENAWVRIETARLSLRELKIPSREALMRMLRDKNQGIRFIATKLAVYYLEEDLRPALAYCASIKGGRARCNARELVERLNWREWAKDPELLAQKKREALQRQREKTRKKYLQELRKGAKTVLKVLEAEGWESLLVARVAGAAYVDWETLYAPLEVGERLNLKREPDNSVDSLAIMVRDSAGHKLGYIPQRDNRKLAQRLDAGKELRTILLKVDRESRVHYLMVEVFGRNEMRLMDTR